MHAVKEHRVWPNHALAATAFVVVVAVRLAADIGPSRGEQLRRRRHRDAELGVKLIPNRSIVWEEKGAKHVASPMPESKAQHTCDYVTNGAGEIVYLPRGDFRRQD